MKSHAHPILRLCPPASRAPLLLGLFVAAGLLTAGPARALVNDTDTSAFSALGEVGGASGVLIADNWVLTAAHVAHGVTAGASTFASVVGSSVVDAVYTFSSDTFPGNDIALLHLGTAIDAAVPVLNDQVIRAPQLSSLGTLTMASAQNATPNGVAYSSATSVKTNYLVDSTSYTVNWLITDGTSYVQGGDSGSALFKGVVSDSGGMVLLGVASADLTQDSGTHQSAYVQVASYKSWINATMASSGQQAIWSATPVPEPSTQALFALGGLAALALRGRIARARSQGA